MANVDKIQSSLSDMASAFLGQTQEETDRDNQAAALAETDEKQAEENENRLLATLNENCEANLTNAPTTQEQGSSVFPRDTGRTA